jgi:ubiquinone/menaquinone biosynthesis C-methylase UbiE
MSSPREPGRRPVDTWKFYDVTHREHLICNPTSEAKLDELVRLLRLPRGSRAIDIACGKAEFLLRLAASYAVSGLGVDISPYFIRDARARHAERAPHADLTFLEMDGAAFTPDRPESFHVASCIGASWIFSGHAGTLEALKRLAVPGGWVVAGEAFWLTEPSSEYLEASGDRRGDFATHSENARAGESLGLALAYTIVSSQDDWDRYEGLQWYATEEYARAHPDDPDLPEIVERVAEKKRTYLEWGRETLGWAIYVFRRPPA